MLSASLAELAKVEGLGEARAKKIKQMLEFESKLKKQSNQSTLEL
jgi:DNA excision repair protein ERCC-4